VRPAILIRLVVYGTVALLGLGAYVARTHAGTEGPRDPRVRLTGRTDHGVATWVDVRDGMVSSIRTGWPASQCEAGASWPAFKVTFYDSEDDFMRDGRSFAVSDSRVFPDANGWEVRSSVLAAGKLSDDGRTASGHAETYGEWLRGGRVMATCRSGKHFWTVRRG
jgi:hypothetical protein